MVKMFVLYLILSWPPLKATPPFHLIQNLGVRKRSSPFPVWFWVFVLFVFFVCVSLRFVRVALVASSRQLGPSGVRLS